MKSNLGTRARSVATVHADLGGRVGANRIVRLSDEYGAGRRQRICRRKPVAPPAGRGRGRCARREENSDRREFQLLQPVSAWISGLVCVCADDDSAVHSGSKSILLPQNAPDPTVRGFGQSFSGVDLKSQIGELRVKHDFSSDWHLVVGALNQVSDRNINTAVNQLLDNSGNYRTYLANSFSSLGASLSCGERFGISGRKIQDGTNTARCRDRNAQVTDLLLIPPSPVLPGRRCARRMTPHGVCQANISDPLVFVAPPARTFLVQEDQSIDGNLRVEHHPPAGHQLRRYHFAYFSLARETRSQSGLDVDRCLCRQRGHRVCSARRPGWICQSRSPVVPAASCTSPHRI